MARRIDAHQHFWKYSAAEYGWIDDRMQILRRDYLPAQLEKEMAASGVDATVAVQAQQTIADTEWLLSLADEQPFIAGVVGWAPIISPDFSSELDRLDANPKLRGLRHVLQAEPDDAYMLREDFHRGIAQLTAKNLVYDILIYDRHLPIAAEFVDRHPNQVFVLDHVAKPKIHAHELSPWRENLRELARRPNVHCKLSGMVTEADWQHWTIDDLRPYAETALEAFGPQRILAGSDWPVCTLASSYHRWWETLEMLLASHSASERDAIFGGNAIEVYQLSGQKS